MNKTYDSLCYIQRWLLREVDRRMDGRKDRHPAIAITYTALCTRVRRAVKTSRMLTRTNISVRLSPTRYFPSETRIIGYCVGQEHLPRIWRTCQHMTSSRTSLHTNVATHIVRSIVIYLSRYETYVHDIPSECDLYQQPLTGVRGC